MPFAQMTESQRASWLAWANSHDWGGEPAQWEGDALTVSTCAHTVQGGYFVEYYSAMTPAELRAWAGY